MADVEEIIDYIKTLKKGFDKDLYQHKIDELAYIVENVGLEHDDFHTLFKVWLNLSIPITKWTNLGACLVPQNKIDNRTVEYGLRWILVNYGNQNNYSRVGFLLDWFTAAMETESIDMDKLDMGYEIFYMLLTFEVLTVHVMKLVYTLTKPVDVTRTRVLELLSYAKKREAKKSMYRQLQVLLGLFKSYKPECVPEDVPAISIHTSFKKINNTLLHRFKICQERRNSLSKQRQHLLWINPLNSERGRNKKVDPLVPNIEFINVGSKQYSDREPQKNYLDFSDPASLLQYSLHHTMTRPAKLRALLCNEMGLALLTLAPDSQQAFLSHELHHLLSSCFLDISPYSYSEKQVLLQRLAVLQRTLQHGIPTVTRFLAQFLPFWNEKDFFAEVLELTEWVNIDCKQHVAYILEVLSACYHRARPAEQCAILNSITNMYCNIVYASSRRQHFAGVKPSKEDYAQVLVIVGATINEICGKSVQVSPDDFRIVYSGLRSSETIVKAHFRSANASGVEGTLNTATLMLFQALVLPSAASIDKLSTLILLYKKLFSVLKSKKELYQDQMQTIKDFVVDVINCLYREESFSYRKTGLVLNKLQPDIVEKICKKIPNADSKLSLRNHLAFAPYTYVQLQAIDDELADNRIWFEAILEKEFSSLSKFLKAVLPELRSAH